MGTCCLQAPALVDDFLVATIGLFMDSHTIDLGDIPYDMHLLFFEDYPSTIVVRAYSDPHVHSLHDQSS